MKPYYALLLLLFLLFICVYCKGERVDLSKYYNASKDVNVEVVTISNIDDVETVLSRLGYEQEEIDRLKEQFQQQIDAYKRMVGENDDDEDDEDDDDDDDEYLDFSEQMRKHSAKSKAKSFLSQKFNKQNEIPKINNNKQANKNIGAQNPNTKNANMYNTYNDHPSSTTNKQGSQKYTGSDKFPKAPASKSIPSPTIHPSPGHSSNLPPNSEHFANPTHKTANSANSANFAQTINFAACQNRKSTCTQCSALSKRCQPDEALLSGGCHASSALSGNFQSTFAEMNGIANSGPPQWFCTTEREAEFISVYVNCCKNNV